MSEIIIPQKSSAYIKILLMSGIPFLYLLFILYKYFMKIEDYNFYLMIFCCLALIICLAFIINAILQLRIRKPAIIINDKGLEDNVSIAKAGFIDWKNITGCFVAKMSGVDQLFIMVKDHSEIMAKQAKFKKGMLSVPIQDHGTPIAIDLKLLNYSAEKLQKIIMKRKKGKG